MTQTAILHRSTSDTAVTHAHTPEGALGQFLAFSWGDEVCHIEILLAQDIRPLEHPTDLVNATDQVLGVVRRHGVIVLMVFGALPDRLWILLDTPPRMPSADMDCLSSLA